jgi:anti-anti-sigma factor
VHRITVENEDGAVVVTAKGEVDAFVADDLTAAFEQAVEDRRIVADFTAVSFLDSTALGLLVRVVREVDDSGGDIRVVLPEGTARRIFELTTLDRVLPVAPSRAQALAELDGSLS